MATTRQLRKAKRVADFEAVVSHYEGAMLRYARRLVISPDIAQDVAQDTFIRLYRKWQGSFEPSSKLSAWLYRVAHNVAVDMIRKQSRRQDLHHRHSLEQPKHAAPDRGPWFHLGDRAVAAAAALQTLSERERQLVVLKIYEDKSYKEIGEITGLTTSNVGYILHHAMKKMAAEIRKAEADEREIG